MSTDQYPSVKAFPWDSGATDFRCFIRAKNGARAKKRKIRRPPNANIEASQTDSFSISRSRSRMLQLKPMRKRLHFLKPGKTGSCILGQLLEI